MAPKDFNKGRFYLKTQNPWQYNFYVLLSLYIQKQKEQKCVWQDIAIPGELHKWAKKE